MSSHIPPKYRDHSANGHLPALAANLADLLDTTAEWTPKTADAWICSIAESIRREMEAYASSPPAVRKKIEHGVTIDCLEPVGRDPRCPPALRKAIAQHLRWRMNALYLSSFKDKARAATSHVHSHP